MISKEEEKNYKKPKISKIWNFLIYGSTIAIGVFLIWLYSAYIFINKWYAYVAHNRINKNGTYRSPKQIADAMGHDLETHLKSYSRFNTKELENAFDFVEERLETIVEKKRWKLKSFIIYDFSESSNNSKHCGIYKNVLLLTFFIFPLSP